MSLYGGVGTEVAKAIVSSLTSSKSEQEKNHYVTAIAECILGRNIAKLNLTNKELFTFTVTLAGLKYAYKVRILSLLIRHHSNSTYCH